MISCICVYSGKLTKLNEAVASFLAQNYEGQKELVIINLQLRQRIKSEIDGVRVLQAPRQMMTPQSRNYAIENAKGDVIVNFPADDICLPNHLTNIANAMEGQSWIWHDKEILMENGRIAKVVPAGYMSFAFTKEAWRQVGKYSFGVNGASDRNFIGKITSQFKGEKVVLSQQSITYIRCGTEAEKKSGSQMVKDGEQMLVPEMKMDYEGAVKRFFGVTNEKKIAVVILGRNGDIISALPFIRLISQNYARPDVLIAREFLPLFDGVSYAKAVVAADKEESLGEALAVAKRSYSIVIRGQIWGRGHTQERKCDSYNLEQWREMGLLHRFHDEALRPMFDQRNPEREAALLASIPDSGKPWLLVNLSSGKSSPCPSCASLMPAIAYRFSDRYQLIDLSQIAAERLYDCLALYEKAFALLTIDTSHAHLVSATNCPTVLLQNPQAWAGTVMRTNCVATIPYDKAVAEPEMVLAAIENAVGKKKMPINYFFEPPATPVERRVFHAVDRIEDADPKTLERKKIVQESWDSCYEAGSMIPAHCWPSMYPRHAKDTIGDPRKLPYLKDLFTHTMAQMDDDDILFFSNDDNAVHSSLPEYLKCHASVWGACSIFRTEFKGKLASMEMTPEQFGKAGAGRHIGRDGFAFTKRWLKERWDDIPDSILAASMWDIHLAALIRLDYSIKTTNANIGEQIFPAEIPAGYTAHLHHHSAWNVKDAHLVPSNMHNGKLFKEFAAKHLPELKVTPEGNLA